MMGRASRGPVVGIWLLALVVTVLVGSRGCSYEHGIDVAVGRGSGDNPLTIYVKTCRQSGAHVISLEELIGGSRTSWGVPIYWQIASRAGSRRAVYTVGRAYPRFVTSVPLYEHMTRGPGDFYGIDVDGAGGMGFTFNDLRSDRVLTSDYDSVRTTDYLASLGGECRTSDKAGERWLLRLIGGLLLGISFFIVVYGVLALLGRFLSGAFGPTGRLRKQTAVAALAVFLGLVALMTVLGEPHQPGVPGDLLPRGAPIPGRLTPSLQPTQHILAEFDSMRAPGDALTSTQFTARGRYVMYVGCSGTSVQVSEGFERPDVAYGARTVAFCNPTIAVPSALDTSPKGIVTLGVLPNGTRRWRVTVATP